MNLLFINRNYWTRIFFFLFCRCSGDNNKAVGGSSGDPDDEPSSSTWFERVLRASVPFQIAIMALLCVACLLEPHCCDNMNNFSYSLSPQLHYVRGPPPI